jgi:3-methyladenine DNA glycosylase AlkC
LSVNLELSEVVTEPETPIPSRVNAVTTSCHYRMSLPKTEFDATAHAQLKEDSVKFVQKSVANHLRDWIKVNPQEAQKIIDTWSKSSNNNTKWILKHAQR